jgi:(E)-4-hydroxy-3-methylbut-2-enyl-diphosphate synthase
MIQRRQTRQLHVGTVAVGGGAPISVQTMTKTDTRDVERTVAQIKDIEAARADIVRCAVPDAEAAEALCAIVPRVSIPVVADIHFDHRLALKVLEGGVACLRLNPGNIGSRAKVEEVTCAAKERGVPIRIGVNAGSLEKEILQKYGWPTAEAMVESALGHVRILEDLDFTAVKVSLKASDVERTVAAYRLFAARTDYPLHLGVTEAGSTFAGTVKSAVGLGILLSDGVGDTVRVSLTDAPAEEVRVGREILKALGVRSSGPVLVSCPTCGRIEVELKPIVEEVERQLADLPYPLTLALMGCAVNGPGECQEADLGLAAGRHVGMIYKQGKPYRKVPEDKIVEEFVAEARKMAAEKIELESRRAGEPGKDRKPPQD